MPSLPSRNAILLGWASELPVLVQMNSLPKEQRPKSDDPDFWAVWSGEGLEEDEQGQKVERSVNWQAIAADWQQVETEVPQEIQQDQPDDPGANFDDDDIPF